MSIANGGTALDTRLLRSFLAVARLASFTEAALELGYTQSTVTSHVQKLERRFHTRLLDRLPSGVQVTDEGARLIPYAEDVLTASARLAAAGSQDGRRIPGTIAGTVRVIAPESLCTYRLPSVVSAIRETEPGIDIWLTPGGIGRALETLRRGKADLALTMEPRLPLSDLTTEQLGSEPLVLVGGAGGALEPAATDTLQTWSDLARRDVLLVEEGCGYSDDVAAKLGATGQATGRRSYFGSIEAIKQCVAVGLGWAALPAIAAVDQIRAGNLRVLDGPPLPDCAVHALTHPRRQPSPAVVAVLERLRETWT